MTWPYAFIRGVPTDMFDEELPLALRTAVPVKRFRRFKISEVTNLVLDTNTTRTFVAICR